MNTPNSSVRVCATCKWHQPMSDGGHLCMRPILMSLVTGELAPLEGECGVERYSALKNACGVDGVHWTADDE